MHLYKRVSHVSTFDWVECIWIASAPLSSTPSASAPISGYPGQHAPVGPPSVPIQSTSWVDGVTHRNYPTPAPHAEVSPFSTPDTQSASRVSLKDALKRFGKAPVRTTSVEALTVNPETQQPRYIVPEVCLRAVACCCRHQTPPPARVDTRAHSD
jgi:hypothetical protein